MKDLKKYKKDMREMFFLSVKRNIDAWNVAHSDIYGPIYDVEIFDSPEKQKMQFMINIRSFELYVKFSRTNDIYISKYKRKTIGLYFIFDYKVYKYVKKIIKYYKNYEKNKKIEEELFYIKNGLNIIGTEYKSDIRKMKLDSLK